MTALVSRTPAEKLEPVKHWPAEGKGEATKDSTPLGTAALLDDAVSVEPGDTRANSRLRLRKALPRCPTSGHHPCVGRTGYSPTHAVRPANRRLRCCALRSCANDFGAVKLAALLG